MADSEKTMSAQGKMMPVQGKTMSAQKKAGYCYFPENCSSGKKQSYFGWWYTHMLPHPASLSRYMSDLPHMLLHIDQGSSRHRGLDLKNLAQTMSVHSNNPDDHHTVPTHLDIRLQTATHTRLPARSMLRDRY